MKTMKFVFTGVSVNAVTHEIQNGKTVGDTYAADLTSNGEQNMRAMFESLSAKGFTKEVSLFRAALSPEKKEGEE